MTTSVKEEVKQHSITKERCQKILDENNGVCDACGGSLEPIETLDNAGNPTFWGCCKSCCKFHWGTPKIVYDIAVKMVDEHHFIAYHHIDNPEWKEGATDEAREYFRKRQIAGTCSTVSTVLAIQKSINKKQNHELLEALRMLLNANPNDGTWNYQAASEHARKLISKSNINEQ